MPQDHYVPQVHLRKWIRPAERKQLRAIRKSDLFQFCPRPKDVCRVRDGSTNYYLDEPRVLEEFLKPVEHNYNAAVEELRSNTPSRASVITIAGLVASINGCSPTAMRIRSEMLGAITKIELAALDRQNLLPAPPPVLGSSSVSELLAAGGIVVDTDAKFPQAISISQAAHLTVVLANSRWEILLSPNSESHFFTSDYPVAPEITADPLMSNKIVPLAPDIVVRIFPDPKSDTVAPDPSLAEFRWRRREASRQEVRALNALIARSAEEHVFYPEERPWVRPFVAKHRSFRVASMTQQVPTGSGSFVWSTEGIFPHVWPEVP